MNERRAIAGEESPRPPSGEWPERADLAASPGVDQDQTTRLMRLMRQTEHLARVGGWELDFTSGSLYWTDETHRIHETDPGTFTPTLESALAFYAPGSREVITQAVGHAQVAGTGWDLELEIITRTGRMISVRATGQVMMSGGKPQRAYGAFQDITERRRLEHQLMAAARMESIGRLAGHIAHDFNNWITAIIGYAELAGQGARPGTPGREAIDRIREAAQHATTLTGQLLSLSRPMPAETSVVDLNELFQTMMPLFKGVIGGSATIRADFAPGPLKARVSASQFRQVLLNLVLNARDAMNGRGTIEIRTQRRRHDPPCVAAVSVGPPTGDCVAFSVSDTGEGMTPEILDRIFEPFFTTKPGGKGTGLGLATCYAMVKASGGHIEATSVPGQGSVFTVTLPSIQTPRAESLVGDGAAPRA